MKIFNSIAIVGSCSVSVSEVSEEVRGPVSPPPITP